MQLPRWFPRCGRPRCRIKIWVLVALFLFNVAVYVAAWRLKSQIAASQLEKQSAGVERELQEELRHSQAHFGTLAALWASRRTPNAAEIRAITHPVLEELPYLLAVAWVDRIDAVAGQTPGAGRAPERPRFALRFTEPAPLHGLENSVDLNSHPDWLQAIEGALRSRNPVAAAPAFGVLGSPGKTDFIVVYPILDNEQPGSALLCVIRLDSLLQTVAQRHSTSGLDFVLRDRMSGREVASYRDSTQPPSGLRRQTGWTFAGRSWILETHAHRDFVDSRLTALPEAAFVLGLILIALMAAQIIEANRSIADARKRARRGNRKLRKLNAALQAEVEERRQAEQRLASYSQQLEQATLLAESSAQAKTNFLATVSHEIRTPMHAIIGMTNILLDSPLNPDQRECAGIVQRSADSLLQIINDILDYSKIEAGKFEVEAVPFDLQQTLSEVMDAVSVRASQKGIALLVGYPSDAPVRFLGDSGAIRQILLNLAGNAVKFTERGQVAVDVLVLEEDEDTARMFISVADTGVGIPEDRLHRLFHPFQQADSSMRRKFGGTGLGLAISKRLTELMGGAITVDSEVNAGTIFQLDLPLKKYKAAISGGYCPLDLRSVQVLVLEPNPAIAAILARQLDGCHIAHRQAYSVAEMQDLLCTENADYRIFLIGGEQSESWDPQQIASGIRQRIPDPVFLRIAPYAVAGERAAMEESGYSAYLVMPVFAAVLMNALGQAWAAARQGIVPKPILTRQSLSDDAAQGSQTEPLAALCRVLLVEDNAVNQKIGRRLLEKLNCSVDIAPNGLAAVRQWSAGTYDVILMDCQMPEMDGFEATAEIRAREAAAGDGRRIPIIAMTANNMQGDREQCLESGMDDFLPKPVSFPELREKLEKAIRQNSPNSHPLQAEPTTADEKSGVAIF